MKKGDIRTKTERAYLPYMPDITWFEVWNGTKWIGKFYTMERLNRYVENGFKV